MSFDAQRLANPAVGSLRAYDPGHDLPGLRQRFGAELAELGSNENPLGPSPLALDAASMALADIHRYPDPRCGLLRESLSDHLGVAAESISVGNGSHELLILLAQCFAGPGRSVVYSEYGFAVFMLAAAAVGARAICVPALGTHHAHAPLGHDLEAMAGAIDADTRLVYLANPNNPTGTWFNSSALVNFLGRVPDTALVVVDEAYHEYVDAAGLDSALRLVDRYSQLVVTRTFSKAYGLAGLRVGYMVSHPSVAAVIERLRESFNVNSAAQAAAAAALADQAHVRKVRRVNAAVRAGLTSELSRRGCRVLPSQTNFLLVEPKGDVARLEQTLLEHAVAVRPMAAYGLAHTVRVSVGSDREIARLLEYWPT